MKKMFVWMLCLVMVLSVAVCAHAEEKTLYYPSYMQDTEGETLILAEEPKRIVCLSNAALQILVRCDIRPVAVTSLSSGVEYPDWVCELPVISVGMNDLDVESVIAMEPDLVIMGGYQKETYGQQLADANIAVYYTSEGPSIAYAEVREEAITLARSFGGTVLADEIEAEFMAVEERAALYGESHEITRMMIFFHTPGTYQQTSQGYLGSMLQMLPFENLSDTVVDPSMRTAPTDLETVVGLNPEIIFAVSPTAPSGEMLKPIYEQAFAENEELWNQIDAVKNGNIIYLGNEYVTSKGMAVIGSLNRLIDLLEAQ